jgi:putative phage-type endonuclease
MLTWAQLATRTRGLGSSDIAAVAGLNPWRAPIDVWKVKTRRASPEANPQTELGHVLEDAIGRLAAKELGLAGIEPNTETYFHEHEDFALATPDFWVLPHRKSELEVKNVGYLVQHHWEHGELPPYVRAQVQWQLEVLKLPCAYVGALLGGRDLRTYRVEYDPIFATELLEIGARFWHDHVVKDVPPPIDGSESARRYLEERFPSHAADLKPATKEIEEATAALRAARAEIAKHQDHEALYANQIRAFIGDAAGVETSLGTITWKRPKDRETTDYYDVAKHLASQLELDDAECRDSIERALAAARRPRGPAFSRRMPSRNARGNDRRRGRHVSPRRSQDGLRLRQPRPDPAPAAGQADPF